MKKIILCSLLVLCLGVPTARADDAVATKLATQISNRLQQSAIQLKGNVTVLQKNDTDYTATLPTLIIPLNSGDSIRIPSFALQITEKNKTWNISGALPANWVVLNKNNQPINMVALGSNSLQATATQNWDDWQPLRIDANAVSVMDNQSATIVSAQEMSIDITTREKIKSIWAANGRGIAYHNPLLKQPSVLQTLAVYGSGQSLATSPYGATGQFNMTLLGLDAALKTISDAQPVLFLLDKTKQRAAAQAVGVMAALGALKNYGVAGVDQKLTYKGTLDKDGKIIVNKQDISGLLTAIPHS